MPVFAVWCPLVYVNFFANTHGQSGGGTIEDNEISAPLHPRHFRRDQGWAAVEPGRLQSELYAVQLQCLHAVRVQCRRKCSLKLQSACRCRHTVCTALGCMQAAYSLQSIAFKQVFIFKQELLLVTCMLRLFAKALP